MTEEEDTDAEFERPAISSEFEKAKFLSDDYSYWRTNMEEEYSSIAKHATNGSMSSKILEFHHSFAYDCRRRFNLCVVEKDIILFASGNLIHVFRVGKQELCFIRGSAGGGIGHLCRNPVYGHIAVGENGFDPPINIYDWPAMKIVSTLHGGTSRRYFRLAYSPDGLLLVSQGGEPDYFITLWNWRDSQIALRCKSYVQDVYNVSFARTIPGHLTSGGSGHIKFWKMSRTFTGLKLKGETGRFGRTEISDVIAVYPMPDETVISGCEWGNILLWEEGLIKFEVCKKNRQTSHTNYITQFEYVNGELVSVGSDGWIRFWFYETIEQADLEDEEHFLEVQPIYEFHVIENVTDARSEDSMLLYIEKQDPDEPENSFWYAQDGNGGIWLIDLSTATKPEVPRKIFSCHAGPIVDIDVADWGPFIASLDASGHLHIYNCQEKRLRIVHKFYDTGSQVIWLPCQVEATGSSLICAFRSGVIRLMTVAIKVADLQQDIKEDYVRLLQVLKPHAVPISCMSFSPSSRLLVTAGEDCTIFAFRINSTETYPNILPLGYVRIPSPGVYLTWHDAQTNTLLTGCYEGDFVEVSFPDFVETNDRVSYELIDCKPSVLKFRSVKSSIQRELVMEEQEKRRKARLEKRREEMEKLRTENPDIIIDEETFLMDFEKDDPLPEIYIPEIPSSILVAQYSLKDTVLLLMSGFDGGYVYEYPRPSSANEDHKEGPIKCRLIKDAENIEIHSSLYFKDRKYLFLGMGNGEIRACRLNLKDETDLSDYWSLPIHDSYNGCIPKIVFSYNRKLLISCGHDGNLFSFMINDETTADVEVDVPVPEDPLPLPTNNVEDIEDKDFPSLEEVATRAEENRILEEARRKKEETLNIVRDLAEEFVEITNRNNSLPQSQQIAEFELDPRITRDLEEQLEAKMQLTREKLAFKVEKSEIALKKLMDHFVTPITCLPFAVRSILNPEEIVHSLREERLTIDDGLRDEARKYAEDEGDTKTGRTEDKADESETESVEQRAHYSEMDYLLNIDLSDVSTGLGTQIRQMLSKYREKREKLKQREAEWKEIHARKPDLSKSHAEDMELLERTRRTIGEYHLKTSLVSGTNEEETATSKYKQLLDCRIKIHQMRENFNERLRAIRLRKQELRDEVLKSIRTLKKIHAEIPEKHVKPLPQVPFIDYDAEFPEHNLELEQYTPMSERVKEAKRQRQSYVPEQSYDPTDLEYEVLLLDEDTIHEEEAEDFSSLLASPKTKIRGQTATHIDFRALEANDSMQTPWEREMKRRRRTRKIYEQDRILSCVQESLELFEKELKDLEERRLDVTSESIYGNLFLLTLYEEFMVLRESEATEDSLREKVRVKAKERSVLKQKMELTTSKINARDQEMRRLNGRIKDLSAEYSTMIRENKYHEFLYKIFKKKASAKRREGSSESTASSESSSEDSQSTDDTEIGRVPFDENICPLDCDRELYDLAFSMREQRYSYEHKIREEQRDVEILKRETESEAKTLKMIDSQLKANEEELRVFMLEKRRRLNDIDVTIVLKFHQLQHIRSPENVPEIRDCIVFDKQKLSNLYARVGELQQETLDLQEKRKKNRTHLKRIRLDCKYMEERNRKLEEEIKEETMRKFGRRVSLTTLYENTLHRMIYDARSDMRPMLRDFDKQIKDVKRDCDEELKVLENVIRDNTEKLSLLTVLEQEKAKLWKILKQEPISEEKMEELEREYEEDLRKLEAILRDQAERKLLLENDIRNLKSRSGKLPPICFKKSAM